MKKQSKSEEIIRDDWKLALEFEFEKADQSYERFHQYYNFEYYGRDPIFKLVGKIVKQAIEEAYEEGVHRGSRPSFYKALSAQKQVKQMRDDKQDLLEKYGVSKLSKK